MKIKTEKIEDGFNCASCIQDEILLAVEATKEAGKQICYDCAFASLRSQLLIEGSVNKYANYDRDETYESEIV
jgi:transcription elongation factor Elf1